MRLNHYIAKSGLCSRRRADCLIKEGKVEVNGQRVCLPFFPVGEDDAVRVEGRALRLKQPTYILLNKPKGVTVTRSDKFAAVKVTDLLPKGLKSLYPVGRLDKDSGGLLILTNDGDFCYRLTHPKFSVEKEYQLKLKGELRESDCQRAKRGIRDGGDFLKLSRIKILQRNKDTICRTVISEGKKRHLRRLFKRLGYPVIDLQRIRVGKFTLGNLKPGEYRIIVGDADLRPLQST